MKSPMGPKKREEKSDFSECSDCGVLVIPKDREKHVASCGKWTSGFDVDYEFIHNQTIYATVREVQVRDPDLENLSMSFQHQVILLSPLTMKLCELDCGGYVHVVTACGCASLKVAWPYLAVGLLSLSPLVPDRDLAPNTRIRIRKWKTEILEAECIELELLEGDIGDEQLLVQAFRRKFYMNCLQRGSLINLAHLCEIVKLKVRNIIPRDSRLESAVANLSLDPIDSPFFKITHRTEFSFMRTPTPNQTVSAEIHWSYDDIGGLRSQKKALQDLTRIAEEKFKKLLAIGKFPPRRILITGPAGTGKSCLVKAAATDLKKEVLHVSSHEIEKLSFPNIALLVKKASRCIVIIENLDTFNGKKDKELQTKLICFLKGLPQQTLILATKNRKANVDEVLQALFDREIETTVPTFEERLEILVLSLRGIPNKITDEELTEISLSLHGYTGANIEALVKEALALSLSTEDEISIEAKHLKEALKVVRPLEMRDVILEIPKVYWKDIGGMEDVKKRFRQCVEWPLLHKEAFQRFNVKPPSGLLMYGPPGCSKTMIARALATESSLNFLAVNGPELFSKWVGDSERAVRELFRRARSVAPAVVFFDEIDAIASQRKNSSAGNGVGDRVLAQLLTEIDGVEGLENVVLIAATNRPDIIDEALLRPGRLDNVVYVPLPDENTRREILRISLRQRQIDDDVSLTGLVEATQGYSGAEIVALVQEAIMKALEESFDILSVGLRHFTQALAIVRPRISQESITFYENFHRNLNKH